MGNKTLQLLSLSLTEADFKFADYKNKPACGMEIWAHRLTCWLKDRHHPLVILNHLSPLIVNTEEDTAPRATVLHVH